MGIFKKLFKKDDDNFISIDSGVDNNVNCRTNKSLSKEKLESLRKEREYYKNELEIEKNRPKRSIVRIWDIECKLDDIEELIMKELKK